jgi:hypothetical protein
MATREVYLSGKAKWAKVYKPDEKYQNWTIQLYMDKDSLKTYQGSGMSMAVKKDDDGDYVTFRRPMAKLIKNELVKFNPPRIIDSNDQPFDKNIGNGSDVTIKVLVYDTIKGPGHRLEAVRIDKWVEYVKADTPAPAAITAGKAQASAGLPPF